MIKYVGFDKDGTLIDSMLSYAKTWGDIFHKEFDLNRDEAKNYLLETSGQANFNQTDDLLKKHGIYFSKEEVFALSNQISEDLALEDNSLAFKDVPGALRKLKENDFKIFVSSNQQEDVVKKDLERTNLLQFIDFYAGIRPQDPGFKKGKPHFEAAANYFNQEYKSFINETIYIGDTSIDVDIANALRVPCIIRKSNNFAEEMLSKGAKFVVEDFSKLPELITSIS
jgi:phosphoglycolate phosphatase-like HAD superfamily hydrolase